jgi:MFS superfamily sulfate permease-like transporter
LIFSNAKQLWGDVTGGIVGSLMVVPIILSCGIVSYQSLGPDYVSAGIIAAFVSAFFAALMAGMCGYPPLHGNCPKTSHAAILSSLIAGIATHHSFSDSFSAESGPQALITICIITLSVSGLTQLLLGAAGLGSIVKFIPHPVLAGFINGFALQIIIGQVPNLLGVSSFDQLWPLVSGEKSFNPYPLCLAMFACILATICSRISKLLPSALVGLTGGTLAYIGLSYAGLPMSFGPVIGQLPTGNYFIPQFGHIYDVISNYSFLGDWFSILTTGVTLALISSIQSLLSISSADELFGTRHNSNKELMVQGAANLLSALFGGTPNGGSPNVTQNMVANGGRTYWANLVSAAVLLSLSFGLGDVIARIPLSVMAGVVILNTLGAMDKWTQQLLKKVDVHHHARSNRSELLTNLIVVILVTVLVVSTGALPALGVGMTLSFLVFLYQAKDTAVRKVLHLNQIMSRIDRPIVEKNILMAYADRVAVFELQGPLFFGAAETVSQLIEAEMATADWIILDFRRNSLVDASGAMTLKRLNTNMNKVNKKLILAYLPVDSQIRQDLSDLGVDDLEAKGRVFEDTDTALAAAEAELLDDLGFSKMASKDMGLAQFELLSDMSKEDLAVLSYWVDAHYFEPGDPIIEAGSDDQGIFFLANGQASVCATVKGRALRLITYRAGIIFGEMALFTGRIRSADVVADTPAMVFELTHGAFERLCIESPMVAIKLLRGLGSGLANRLVATTQIVRELES